MSLIIVYVLVLHLIADYVLQPNWIQTYKSQNNSLLLLHAMMYFTVLFGGLLLLVPWHGALWYSGVNALLHLMVDYASSRIIYSHGHSMKIKKGVEWDDKAPFERVDLYLPCLFLGVDQLIHQICLLTSLHLLTW